MVSPVAPRVAERSVLGPVHDIKIIGGQSASSRADWTTALTYLAGVIEILGTRRNHVRLLLGKLAAKMKNVLMAYRTRLDEFSRWEMLARSADPHRFRRREPCGAAVPAGAKNSGAHLTSLATPSRQVGCFRACLRSAPAGRPRFAWRSLAARARTECA
jgi:hypothetical protein